LIFLSFPLIALQSTTTQTDLVTMVFFVTAVYFLFLGLRDGQPSLLALSAIAVGLGFGVKKSYILLLPVLGILALLALWQFGKSRLKLVFLWSLNVVVGIALLGAYIYVVNWRYFGDPFGSPAYFDSLIEIPQTQESAAKVMLSLERTLRTDLEPVPVQNGPFPGEEFLLELAYNAPRLLYQALDTSGLPSPLDGYAHKVKLRLARPVFQAIGFEEIEGTAYTAPGHTFNLADKNINEESHAWYGPLSALLLFPALFVEAWRGIRKRSWLSLAPVLALLLFLPMEIILRPGWDPFQGRYFAPLVALGAPLMAMWFRERGRSRL
jgi:4-amino-4-deoxy-L-arabinose transferase-like glycosyltransferase